jgi:superfamily II DNA helicase RecQ
MLIVFSPLSSLMKTHSDEFNSILARASSTTRLRSLRAEYICDLQTDEKQIDAVKKRAPGIAMLYVSPEVMFATNSTYRSNVEKYGNRLIDFVEDEAHVIPEWGDEFRPVSKDFLNCETSDLMYHGGFSVPR